ncbi:hypothetical protein HYV22_03675 [Candidatus Gottesmanbacteria bacterium]|nr:hypothetical protein [Candidatus Gottesmanbacteria bacterium]
MKHMKEGEKISQIFEAVAKAGERYHTSGTVTSKEEGIRKAVEKVLKIAPIDVVEEKQKSQRFVLETKQRAQSVDSRKTWASEHRYVVPRGATPPEHLNRIKDVLQALNVSTKPELVRVLGPLDPNTLQSFQAAEYVARLAVAPNALLEDPNYLFREAAKLASSKDSTMTSDARNEVDSLLNKAILRIRELRTKDFAIKGDEELTYTLRGLVIYDEELDGVESDPHLRGVLQKNMRRREALPGLSADQEKNLLLKMRERMESGEVQEVAGGKREFHIYDPLDATKYLQRITRHIEGLDRILEQERSFIGWEPENASEAMSKIGIHLRSRSLTTDELEALKHSYESLPLDEQEHFKTSVKIKIRQLISELEGEPAPKWERGHITSPQQLELGGWFHVLKQVDVELWKELDDEEQGRNWLHLIIKTMEKGSSPFDTKNLLGAQQEFDKMEFHERIAKLPGVNRVYQLLDERYEEFFRAETNPVAKKEFEESIIEQIRREGICNTEETGITSKDAFRIGYRHWKEVGREGWMLRTYIRGNKLIETVEKTDSHGKKYYEVIIDENTPIMWDPLRLIYCPEAMWAFFGFGSNRAGEKVRFMNFNGKLIEAQGARGVGADVIKKLLDSGLDFLVQDYYSRRKGYVLPAWIEDQLDKLPDTNPERVAWYATKGKLKQEKGDTWQVFSEVYGLRKKTTKLRMNVEFALHEPGHLDGFGTQVWELSKPAEGEIKGVQDEVKKLREEAAGNQELLDILDQIEAEYPNAAKRAEEINIIIQQDRYNNNIAREVQGKKLEWYEDPTFAEAFLTMKNFDISRIPFVRMRRLQENVRGNFRDHFTALTIYQAFGNFINDPTPENLMKIPVKDAKGYTALQNIQARMIVPAYNALVDVQRGKGPLGKDWGMPFWLSKYGALRDVDALDDRELYKVIQWLVANEYIDKRIARKLRSKGIGGRLHSDFLGLVYDKGLQYADPIMLAILFFGMLQKQMEQLVKEAGKEA